MDSMDVSWYYRNGQKQSGPVDHDALESLYRGGLLTNDSEVRRGESGVWIKVSRFFGSVSAGQPQASASASRTMSVGNVVAGVPSWQSIDDLDLSDEPVLEKIVAPRPQEEWYYKILGQEFGPISFAELCEQCQLGVVGRNDTVRQDGHTDWMFAHLVLKLIPFMEAAQPVVQKSTSGLLSPQRGMPADLGPRKPKQTKSAPVIAVAPPAPEPQLERPTDVPKSDTQVPASPKPMMPAREMAASAPPAAAPAPRSYGNDFSPPRPAYTPPPPARMPPPRRSSSSSSGSSMSFDFGDPKVIGGIVAALVVLGAGYWYCSGAVRSSRDDKLIQTYVGIYYIINSLESDAELKAALESRIKPQYEDLKKQLESEGDKSRPIVQLLSKSAEEDIPNLMKPKLKDVEPARLKMFQVIQEITKSTNS